MAENDKKLWEEIENCLEYDDDIYGGDSVFLHTTSIENLMDLFKSKEIDVLKEFVEWLKEWLEYLERYEKDLYSEAIANHDSDNIAFFRGRINMLMRLLSGIDLQLELFMEKKK